MPIFSAIQRRTDLRGLILLLVIGSGFLILLSTLSAAYHVQREALIKTTLEGNQVYAARVAKTLEQYLQDAEHALTYVAAQIEDPLERSIPIQEAIRQLQQQNRYFNSVFRVDAQGQVIHVWPKRLQYLEGRFLDTVGNRAALAQKQPMITPPYMSSEGNLMIQISHPIRDAQGGYQGYLGGSIHLDDSSLQSLIDQQPFQNGTYVYVVNLQGQLIYHPEPHRVGEFVLQNPVVRQLMQGKSGCQRLKNTQGIDMLAGYLALPSLGWGIVVQRPTEKTLASLDFLMQDVIDHTFPLLVVVLPIIFGLAQLISKPLRQLADNSQDMGDKACIPKLKAVSGWYYEAQRMQQVLLQGIATTQEQMQQLRVDAYQDALTGLYNRRGLDRALNELTASGQNFSVIALDIDFFKQVNDTYGHAEGDRVIQALAHIMRLQAKGKDILCRTGGEEFLILLPQTNLVDACTLAEQLRHEVEICTLIPNHPLSISLGVASYNSFTSLYFPEQALTQADQALYAAKRNGRNRVVSNPPDVCTF